MRKLQQAVYERLLDMASKVKSGFYGIDDNFDEEDFQADLCEVIQSVGKSE